MHRTPYLILFLIFDKHRIKTKKVCSNVTNATRDDGATGSCAGFYSVR